jgi:hypothetical protein
MTSPDSSGATLNQATNARGIRMTSQALELAARQLADSPAAQKTRAALLTLGDVAHDHAAATTLWEENHEIIEFEMILHLHNCFDPQLRERILSRLASQARFFSDDLDHPQEWVARCANLEVRRLALELRK